MSMGMGAGHGGFTASFRKDANVVHHILTPGTTRRVVQYAAPFLGHIVAYLGLTVVSSLLVVATPLLLQRIIDDLHELGFRLVIEGEVAQADVDELRQLGVELAQSHLIAEPMDAAAVLRWAARACDR